jgi:hypothetical protein
MPQLRLTNLRRPITQPEVTLIDEVTDRLGVELADISRWRILRKSLDARSRYDLEYVYSIFVEVPDGSPALERTAAHWGIEYFTPDSFIDPPAGPNGLSHRPVIVGAGPAGILAAYYLAVKGYQPLVLERGYAVKERVPAIREFDAGGAHNEENNYLYGEGGAGCFSDGKLTCRMSGPDVDWVMQAFVACGGRDSIIYEHRPHLGSNKLPMICRNFRRKIEELGGEYKFGCMVEKIDLANGQIKGLHTSTGYIPTDVVIFGPGHSARDTYSMLHELGFPLVQKPFQLGLRIEQPQTAVNEHKYGRDEYLDLLGPADYTMNVKGPDDVYTFCMCAGGYVIPSISEPGMYCSNGMSYSRHDSPFANSGVMVTLNPEDFGSTHPLAGIEVQRHYEAIAYGLGQNNYLAPIQWARDFVQQKKSSTDKQIPSSYLRGTKTSDLSQVLPEKILAAIRRSLPIMDRKWRGQYLKEATLVGPEMRGSAPVRIERDYTTRETNGFTGFYPVGEGAGYAGGIISAAVDGLRSAKSIVEKYQTAKVV